MDRIERTMTTGPASFIHKMRISRGRLTSGCLVVAAVIGVTACVAQGLALNLQGPVPMVTVSNSDNPADSNGYGSVDHWYRIGKYEVTNGAV